MARKIRNRIGAKLFKLDMREMRRDLKKTPL